MTHITPPAYADLEARFKRVRLLEDTAGMLRWDMASIMPSGGAQARSEQLAMLSLLRHEALSDGALADGLSAAEEEQAGLDVWQQANLREMRRVWVHSTALDAETVERASRAANICEMKWRDARPNSDYDAVLPSLREVLDVSREIAAVKAEVLGVSAYDALLDQYEPGGSSERIDTIFAGLEAELPDLIQAVLDRQAAAGAPIPLDGPFPVAQQRVLGEKMMSAIGFDFTHGRLDVSHHPFCGGVPEDVRLTTRYDEADFTRALMGVLHETGHAMYERQLPSQWRYQPVGEARGMALHESQSLLIEMQACRSEEFLEFAAPLFREAFGVTGPAWELENLKKIYHRVSRGFIRVDADEVTYPAHVLLRYKLEKALISGDMDLADLPGAWNDEMQRLLGVTPPTLAEGCMQDIHWFDGAWGYFPTYTLGAMAGAQIFSAAREQIDGVMSDLNQGDFSRLMTWLGQNIHGQASVMDMDGILEAATGRALDPTAFLTHLKKRYLGA